MNTTPIRVLVVDDHATVREGTRAFLEEISGIKVIGDAANGKEALRLVQSLHPDVILLDLMMPEMDGVETIQQIQLQSQNENTRIVVMTSFIAEEKLFSALMVGANNYLLKDSSPDEMVEKIRQSYHSQSDLHPKIARKILDTFTNIHHDEALTSHQTDILELLSTGITATEAAQQIGIQEAELRRQVFQILRKLHQFSKT